MTTGQNCCLLGDEIYMMIDDKNSQIACSPGSLVDQVSQDTAVGCCWHFWSFSVILNAGQLSVSTDFSESVELCMLGVKSVG
jgi:hypothetical protein